MRRLRLLLLAPFVAGGCGGAAAGIGQTAASRLIPQVEQVRAAATSGDPTAAAAKLALLRASVADLRQRNQLSEAGAAKVLTAAAEVEAQLGTGGQGRQVSTTVSPAPSVPNPSTQPQAPADDEGDKGKGKGKGKD